MDPEFQDIEDTLVALRPAALEPACMERFLAAVEGRLQAAEPALAALEKSLGGMSPLELRGSLAGALLENAARVPFPVDEKVVLFPGASRPAAKVQARRPWYAAAAAVAVAGAFSALMVNQPEPRTGGTIAETRTRVPGAQATGFVPASFGSGVEEASDEGVMWTPDGKPMRMVRVIYMDRAKYRDEQGKIIEFERPRVEYIMVPEKID
jgi:hypothetical protein